MDELTAEEFTHLVLIASAPPLRVGEVVSRLIGDEIAIGPLKVGPGKVATATAKGVRGQVRATTCEGSDWHQMVSVPISLSVDVALGGRSFRYHGAVLVQTRLRLKLERPCTVAVETEDVRAEHIKITVEPVGIGARVLGWLGSVNETVAEQVLIYVRDLMKSPEFDTALHIDVMGLMQRAWEADLVVELPDQHRKSSA